jgi:hypothetical protein
MDGLWTAEFGSSTGISGGGVAIFRDGLIWGGDATYYYTGSYTVAGKEFKASLTIFPYIEGAESVFGTIGKELTIDLQGSLVSEREAIAQGYPRGMPGFNFGAKLTKRK